MIQIVQGHNHRLPDAEINVVIDVIRAFTVAHYAFIHGVKGMYLVKTTDEAFRLKANDPEILLAGEIQGLAIPGFDLDNSPARLREANLSGRTLIQKTTNGVEATLNSLNAEHIYVTGFSNARTTSAWLRTLWKENLADMTMHLIASHPTGDEDLACAEFMAGVLLGEVEPTAQQTIRRIRGSEAAAKFFDPEQPAFSPEDIELCALELDAGFVMKVNRENEIPMIEPVEVK
ncbi:2-phosphosulfolactate phosphatase [Paenibacillus macerans]|uniref:2-phosphosulfolactate phosphatase n=1 Tax=Paenibacillus macerans TaxID=44252 RepID=UPI003D31184E